MNRIRSFLGCACLSFSALAVACASGGEDAERTVTQLSVTLTDSGCKPSGLQAPAGLLTFIISNTNAETVTRFQVIESERVLGQADDVRPGATKSFTRDMKAGTYRVVCGTAGAEGTLTVAG